MGASQRFWLGLSPLQGFSTPPAVCGPALFLTRRPSESIWTRSVIWAAGSRRLPCPSARTWTEPAWQVNLRGDSSAFSCLCGPSDASGWLRCVYICPPTPLPVVAPLPPRVLDVAAVSLMAIDFRPSPTLPVSAFTVHAPRLRMRDLLRRRMQHPPNTSQGYEYSATHRLATWRAGRQEDDSASGRFKCPPVQYCFIEIKRY